MAYAKGDVVALPPREIHCNSSKEGFTNIHMRVVDPSFPYRNAFRVPDGQRGQLLMAFAEAKVYFVADNKQREVVLSALGDLISSYLLVYRSNSELSRPVEQIRSLIFSNYDRMDLEVVLGWIKAYDPNAVLTLEGTTGEYIQKAVTTINGIWERV